jgi:hypothetical protein
MFDSGILLRRFGEDAQRFFFNFALLQELGVLSAQSAGLRFEFFYAASFLRKIRTRDFLQMSTEEEKTPNPHSRGHSAPDPQPRAERIRRFFHWALDVGL